VSATNDPPKNGDANIPNEQQMVPWFVVNNETEILGNFACCKVTDRIAILGATVFFLKNFEELGPTRR
jgi:hypothetical protein